MCKKEKKLFCQLDGYDPVYLNSVCQQGSYKHLKMRGWRKGPELEICDEAKCGNIECLVRINQSVWEKWIFIKIWREKQDSYAIHPHSQSRPNCYLNWVFLHSTTFDDTRDMTSWIQTLWQLCVPNANVLG